MPRFRTKKKNYVKMPASTTIDLYLEYYSADGDKLKVPLPTLITISTLRIADVISNFNKTTGSFMNTRT